VIKESKIKAFIAISRGNLLLATASHAVLGFLFAANGIQEILNYPILAFVLLHLTLAVFACNINSYFDYEVDRRYKRYMSDAVDVIGKKNIRFILGFEFAVALALIAYLLTEGKILPGLLAVVGMFFAISYSAKPLRIKGRGWMSQLPIFIGLYMIPLFAGYLLIMDSVLPSFVIFVLGYAMMNEGFTIVNSCEDYSEDKSEGICTWAHLLGLDRSIKVAFVFVLAGLMSVAVLVSRMSWLHIGTYEWLALIFSAVSVMTILAASIEVYRIRHAGDLEASAKIHAQKLSRWFIITRYPLVAIAFLLLL
jgi:4-hydroxybenzoate polyprenyltransferase